MWRVPPWRRLDTVDPHRSHHFYPRKHGSPDACEHCGGVRSNQVHPEGMADKKAGKKDDH